MGTEEAAPKDVAGDDDESQGKEKPPPGQSKEVQDAWKVMLERRDEIIRQREEKKNSQADGSKVKGSGGWKCQAVKDAEAIVAAARIPFPDKYVIAPDLRALMKRIAAGEAAPAAIFKSTVDKPVRRKRSAEASQPPKADGNAKKKKAKKTDLADVVFPVLK